MAGEREVLVRAVREAVAPLRARYPGRPGLRKQLLEEMLVLVDLMEQHVERGNAVAALLQFGALLDTYDHVRKLRYGRAWPGLGVHVVPQQAARYLAVLLSSSDSWRGCLGLEEVRVVA